MKKKIRLGIIFGGKSAEHEISLQSAKNVIGAIDREKFDVVLIYIGKDGRWHLENDESFSIIEEKSGQVKLEDVGDGLGIIPGGVESRFFDLSKKQDIETIDVLFPLLHGPFGEDGTLQGLIEMLNIPYVGAGVLGSSVGMDKDVMKRLLRDAGIRIADFMTFHRSGEEAIKYEEVKQTLGMPVFIKPSNLGSSVGISKSDDPDSFREAIDLAFKYDNKIIIEEYIKGREIECSVLGNENPIASLPGEILPRDGFYSYRAKYIDEDGAGFEIPARLSNRVSDRIRKVAVNAFKVLCCEGMARVDIFFSGEGEIIVNEINTIPGFTSISMYPKLWEVSGISYGELIERLISLAIERKEKEDHLKTSYI